MKIAIIILHFGVTLQEKQTKDNVSPPAPEGP